MNIIVLTENLIDHPLLDDPPSNIWIIGRFILEKRISDFLGEGGKERTQNFL